MKNNTVFFVLLYLARRFVTGKIAWFTRRIEVRTKPLELLHLKYSNVYGMEQPDLYFVLRHNKPAHHPAVNHARGSGLECLPKGRCVVSIRLQSSVATGYFPQAQDTPAVSHANLKGRSHPPYIPYDPLSVELVIEKFGFRNQVGFRDARVGAGGVRHMESESRSSRLVKYG